MADQLTGLLSPFLRSRRIAAVEPFLANGRLLDIGCGTGTLANHVNSTRYLGVDQDEESIAIAKKLFPTHRFLTLVEFTQSPNENQFERMIGLAVIEHVEDPQKWLAGLRKLLKPGGQVVLTTPHPSVRWLHEFGGHIGLFSREGAKEHRELINRDRMIQLAETSGFRIRHFRRFLLGCNQLFVLEPISLSSRAERGTSQSKFGTPKSISVIVQPVRGPSLRSGWPHWKVAPPASSR